MKDGVVLLLRRASSKDSPFVKPAKMRLDSIQLVSLQSSFANSSSGKLCCMMERRSLALPRNREKNDAFTVLVLVLVLRLSFVLGPV